MQCELPFAPFDVGITSRSAIRAAADELRSSTFRSLEDNLSEIHFEAISKK